MSAVSTIGSVCIKDEVKGTEYSCACTLCQLLEPPKKQKLKDSFIVSKTNKDKKNG